MRRRLVTVFAVMALGLSSLAVAAPAAADASPPAYVALGDSEAAGTGNLPYVDADCKRSKKSYPLLLGQALGLSVASSACAEADTTDVVLSQLGDLSPATQLVTITVGANDVGWLDLVLACTTGTAAQCLLAQQQTITALGELPPKIVAMLAAVRTAAPNAMIVVTGYPLLFGAVTDSCSIGAFQGSPVKVSAQQAAMANALISEGLNAALLGGVEAYKALTQDPGVEFVDVTQEFAGHGLCDTGERWVSGLVSGGKTADRSLHLNSPGQAALAQILALEIAG